jgi:hypothetical protein
VWPRITEIATAVAPRLSIPRGPKISAASTAHEFLLKELVSVTRWQGYTWDPCNEASRKAASKVALATKCLFWLSGTSLREHMVCTMVKQKLSDNAL